MRIGFYGDSFCENYPSCSSEWDTYLKQIADNYGIERKQIVNFGFGGSSIWDTILIQFGFHNAFSIEDKTFPDVMVFVWTDASRLFHRTIRSLNMSSTFNTEKIASQYNDSMDIIDAAQKYYTHLADFVKEDFAYNAALRYFDQEILSKISHRCKIIHLWSFFKPSMEMSSYDSNNYYYRWQNGMEIRPALIKLSLLGMDKNKTREIMGADKRMNHLDGDYKNSLLANTIISAIDNYENGKLITYL